MNCKLYSHFLISFCCAYIATCTSCKTAQSCNGIKVDMLLEQVSEAVDKIRNYTKESCGERAKPEDCEDILKAGSSKSGSYDIWPKNRILKGQYVKVYCDMETDGGGWTVFQRRGDYGRTKDYFFKDWSHYQVGFGKVTEDFWLGNDAINAITNQKPYVLRIDMRDLQMDRRYAQYDQFWIDSEEYLYKLHVTGFKGNAGDSYSGHSGMSFSTKDRDNDAYADGNCATMYKGAWWYSKCHSSNLNGLYLNGTHSTYADGIEWSTWRGQNYSLPFVEMKVRSADFEKTSLSTSHTDVNSISALTPK